MSLLPPDPSAGSTDDQVCIPEHCFHAFDTLFCALTSNEPIPPMFPDDKYPLFVTWNVRPSRPGRGHRLRGCIGSFEPHALHEGIAEYALISAFKDYRFNRITRGELDSLECVVSLLTDFEDASSYLDWTIGVHGIYITFPHPSLLIASQIESSSPSPLSSSTTLSSPGTTGPIPSATYKKTFNATYLPEVMPAQGWDKIEAVDSAIHKAGWSGRITEEIRRSVKLRRYQSRACTITWYEFVEWRKANAGKM
ncbi:hypothetical protein BDM02DRAFT_3251360 [Thelephora ganbajun]|uniref:Uncharacterized protein n=1 Tax=Thelephora ganbajun TaxID=370292 RepID=A0ACB6ZCC1_THEGA|nr:hypothetical protein BDM02DRAFT_3251360 [Thelephora ganbajun]